MTVYTASNGTIIADLTALKAIVSTNLPTSGFVVLFVAAENSWFEYNSTLTSGDATPSDNPTIGRWIRIGRDKLTANRTYYVRTDGNDSNTGLVNTSGGAFLTITKAINILSSLEGNGFIGTIQCANGAYDSPIILRPCIGFSTVILQGNSSSTSSVTVTTTGALSVVCNGAANSWTIKNISFSSPSSAVCISVNSQANLILEDVAVGGATIYHVGVRQYSVVEIKTKITINSSNGVFAFYCDNGRLVGVSANFTIIGSQSYTALTRGINLSSINVELVSLTGGFTGSTYNLTTNSVYSQSDSGLPATGSVATGAQAII